MQQSNINAHILTNSGTDFLSQCRWMGLASFPLIAFSAVFVAVALVIECVKELQKYNAQDLSGALIALGLLRELGPLVVSLGWAAHVAAIVCNQVMVLKGMHDIRIRNFIGLSCLAAVCMAVPLGIFGLVIGFITGGLSAPLIGQTASADFFESARNVVRYKDAFIYFFKLVLVNPIIGVMVGCYCGAAKDANAVFAAGKAVTVTFITGYFANLIVTFLAFCF